MTRNLGRAFSILATAQAVEIHLHHDISAFGGCGDCHASVSRGEAKRQRAARRHARAVSGLSRRGFNRALRHLPQRAFDRAVSAALVRISPYN